VLGPAELSGCRNGRRQFGLGLAGASSLTSTSRGCHCPLPRRKTHRPGAARSTWRRGRRCCTIGPRRGPRGRSTTRVVPPCDPSGRWPSRRAVRRSPPAGLPRSPSRVGFRRSVPFLAWRRRNADGNCWVHRRVVRPWTALCRPWHHVTKQRSSTAAMWFMTHRMPRRDGLRLAAQGSAVRRTTFIVA
jgi:hypothetical protein